MSFLYNNGMGISYIKNFRRKFYLISLGGNISDKNINNNNSSNNNNNNNNNNNDNNNDSENNNIDDIITVII